jgi:hypothetical protein
MLGLSLSLQTSCDRILNSLSSKLVFQRTRKRNVVIFVPSKADTLQLTSTIFLKDSPVFLFPTVLGAVVSSAGDMHNLPLDVQSQQNIAILFELRMGVWRHKRNGNGRERKKN